MCHRLTCSSLEFCKTILITKKEIKWWWSTNILDHKKTKPFCKEYKPQESNSAFCNKNQWCNSQQTHANTRLVQQHNGLLETPLVSDYLNMKQVEWPQSLIINLQYHMSRFMQYRAILSILWQYQRNTKKYGNGNSISPFKNWCLLSLWPLRVTSK